MESRNNFTRRSFFALAAAGPLATGALAGKNVPVGLELWSVRKTLAKDLMGTVRAVGEMGYDGVEFFSSYTKWTPEYAKQVRKLLDDLSIRCYSTHNSRQTFSPENLPKAIELNKIIGSGMIVMASAGKVDGLDGWKKVAAELTSGAERMKSAGLGAGYHNHSAEFTPLDGKRPIEVIAANTPKEVTLQLDVGTCVETGNDPVAWINENPGRIRSIHCKDWSPAPGKGYKVLFGEGKAPWKAIFAAAEKVGGVRQYLIEQEGSRYPELDTVKRCLASFKKLHA